MFTEYQKSVLFDYQKKRAKGSLSHGLVHPTPGKLRDECLMVLRERYSKNDEKALRLFFGPQNNQNDFLSVAERFDVDKFRPLLKFIKNQTDNTDDKNIELLAWLIDYRERPYRFSLKPRQIDVNELDLPFTQDQVENEMVTPAEDQELLFDEPVRLVEEIPDRLVTQAPVRLSLVLKSIALRNQIFVSNKIRAALVALLLTLGTGAYLAWFKPISFTGEGQHLNSGGCMAWKGDHYEKSACNAQAALPGITVPLDTFRLNHFKKIADTVRVPESAIGRYWYFKRDKHLELFTIAGYHPLDTARWLKPLSRYMFDKYLTHQSVTTAEPAH